MVQSNNRLLQLRTSIIRKVFNFACTECDYNGINEVPFHYYIKNHTGEMIYSYICCHSCGKYLLFKTAYMIYIRFYYMKFIRVADNKYIYIDFSFMILNFMDYFGLRLDSIIFNIKYGEEK